MSTYPLSRVHDILRRMEDNSSQSEAMKTCFGILAIMSREDSNKVMIAKDGMDAILNAMTAHVDKVDVQEAGCDLLWSLAFNNGVAKDIIGKHGGAGVLVRALKRHSRSADFLKSACGALSNLCQTRVNQQGVASQGGLQPLVGAIHIHQANSKLLPFLFDALASLIVSNEENARAVSSQGGVPLIIAALGRHKVVVDVVKSGCHSLAILSDVKGQASKIAFAGGVPTILPLLDIHPSYADLHRVAAVVLLRMLQESSHVAREITCNDGVRILLKSLEKGGSQQDTVAAVTHILFTVTNPASPSSSSIETQLWLPNQADISLESSSVVAEPAPVQNQSQKQASSSAGNPLGGAGRIRSRFSRPDVREMATIENTGPTNGAGAGMAMSGASSTTNNNVLQMIRQQPNPQQSYADNMSNPSTSSTSSGSQTALGGLVKALEQYSDRRDVVRASSRLLSNLIGFPGVAQSLDKLGVAERILECVNSHADTRDVVESAANVLKAIYKKSLPVFSGSSKNSLKGLLTLFRSKINDDDVVAVCAEMLAKCIFSSSVASSSFRKADGEERLGDDGPSWERETIFLCNRCLHRIVGIDSTQSQEPAIPATPPPDQSPKGFATPASVGGTMKRSQWNKNSPLVLGALLTVIEAAHGAFKLASDPIVGHETFAALQAVADTIPPKHLELCRRVDKLLATLNPSEHRGDSNKNRKADGSQAAVSCSPTASLNSLSGKTSGKQQQRSFNSQSELDSGLDLNQDLVSRSSAARLVNSSSSSDKYAGGKASFRAIDSAEDTISLSTLGSTVRLQNGRSSSVGSSRSSSIVGDGLGRMGGVNLAGSREVAAAAAYNSSLPTDEARQANRKGGRKAAPDSKCFARVEEYVSRSTGKATKRLYPLHPLRDRDAKLFANNGDSPRLLDSWPSYHERLLVSPGSMQGHGLSDGTGQQHCDVPERMHLSYESESAAGRGLQSRCPTPVPYVLLSDAEGGGLGEPFEHSLTFDSEFESGNLLRAVQRGDAAYDLFLRADLHTTGHTQWFYFAVSNTHPAPLVRLADQGVQVPPVRVRFNIVNLTKPDSLYNLGMRPVMYSCQDAATKKIGWLRAGSDISYFSNSFLRNNTAGEGLTCYFTLSFTMEFHNAQDTYLIAYTYPYTYEDYKVHLSSILDKPGSADIVRHAKLCSTLGGNDCDLLIVTNFKDKSSTGPLGISTTEAKDSKRAKLEPEKLSKSMGCKQPKRCLVLTARVHPGETPASWMMKGMLDFLTSGNPAAVLLRQVTLTLLAT